MLSNIFAKASQKVGGAGLTRNETCLSGGLGILPLVPALAGGLPGRYPGGTGGGAFRTGVPPKELEALELLDGSFGTSFAPTR